LFFNNRILSAFHVVEAYVVVADKNSQNTVMKTKIVLGVVITVAIGAAIGLWGSRDTTGTAVQPQPTPISVAVAMPASHPTVVAKPAEGIKLEAHVSPQFDTK
jgi:hypothetical protein